MRARKRLDELLVSEPDIRLAIINAVLRDVATKQDLVLLREEFRRELRELREYADRRFLELKEYVDKRFEKLESKIKGLRSRLWWVIATVILGWVTVTLEQLLLFMLKGG